MKLRSIILVVVAILSMANVMAQSKRSARKRPAKRTAVSNNKKQTTNIKVVDLNAKEQSKDSAAVKVAPLTPASAASVPAPAVPATSVPVTAPVPTSGSAENSAQTPASVPASTPASVPASTPASVPTSTPASVPASTSAQKPAVSEKTEPAPVPVVPKDRVDTIYYNKNWKVTTNKAFANYYRYALYPVNPSMTKEFKTYYMDGNLQSEGSFLELDKNDDANSKFVDAFVSYYKDGKVEEKKNFVDGKLEGEYTTYYNNGNINKHFLMSDGARNGLAASFTEDGRVCTLTPYASGQAEGYYVMVDIDGNYSKYSLADKQLMLEKPNPSEIKTEYKNGLAWPYYKKNGLIVGACNAMTDDIGDYRRVGLFVVNKSMVNIDLDPSQVEIYSMKKGKRKDFEKVTTEVYNDKIKKYLRKNSAFLATQGNTDVNANLGAQVFNNNSNTVKDFQTRICRMYKLDEGTRVQLSEKAPQDLGYLERTTIHPGEVVYGYIYTDDRKGVDLYVDVKINGIDYLFEWDDSKK